MTSSDDAVRAYTELMEGKVDAGVLADGVRLIQSAQTQFPAVGRVTGGVFNIEVQLELTSGDDRAFKGRGGMFSVTGNVEIGGTVYTADSARLFELTTGFTMTADGAHLAFLDNDLHLLGHFSGTATGTSLGKSPAIGEGKWFTV